MNHTLAALLLMASLWASLSACGQSDDPSLASATPCLNGSCSDSGPGVVPPGERTYSQQPVDIDAWDRDAHGGGLCGVETQPCAGDVVGSWTITIGCNVFLDVSVGPPDGEYLGTCDGYATTVIEELAGQMSFTTLGLFDMKITSHRTVAREFPKACLKTGSCAELTSLDADVVDENDVCRTSNTETSTDSQSGRYTSRPGVLKLEPTGGISDDYEVCASGRTFTMVKNGFTWEQAIIAERSQ